MQKTSNYNLNQWDPTDPIRREDFNADNAAIDAALGQSAKIVVGTYTGTGTYGSANKNSLTFDFAPKMILIAKQNALYQENFMAIIPGQQYTHCFGITDGDGRCHLLWSDDGKTVSWYNSYDKYAQMNENENVYCYSAIG